MNSIKTTALFIYSFAFAAGSSRIFVFTVGMLVGAFIAIADLPANCFPH